jgi:selenocysteine lyase/cysteine desulfurase
MPDSLSYRCTSRQFLIVASVFLSLSASAQTRKEYRYTVQPKPVITITNSYGAITVQPSGTNQVVVTTISYSNDISFLNEQAGNRIELRAESKHGGTGLGDYLVLVPADSNVSLRRRRTFMYGTIATLTRREMVRSTMAFAAWPALRLPSLERLPVNSPTAPDDEEYWSQICSQFEWEPESSNLVTVVRGISTKRVCELAARRAKEFDSLEITKIIQGGWKDSVRKKVADFIGAPVENVALLRNTTEGVTTVLSNWPLKQGDEILTSSAEHGPFYGALAQRAARDGVTIRRFHYPAPATSSHSIVDAVDRAMTARTRLVMVGHIVLFGQINPVREIADLVHARNAKLLVDGVLAIGHIPTDVKAMNCDFYAAGFHKFACGPRATAAFYVRPGLVEQLPPLFGRYTENEHGIADLKWNSAEITKYETFGAHPDGQFLALGDAVDFLSRIGVEHIQKRLFYLTSRWMTRAQSVPGFRAAVKLNPRHCAGLVGFELSDKKYEAVDDVLYKLHVLVGGTESYAGFFGIPENAPRSLFCPNAGLCTSLADVDRLAEAIELAAHVA